MTLMHLCVAALRCFPCLIQYHLRFLYILRVWLGPNLALLDTYFLVRTNRLAIRV